VSVVMISFRQTVASISVSLDSTQTEPESPI
jgi:hypothetical protein